MFYKQNQLFGKITKNLHPEKDSYRGISAELM
jgi:hypothetical protein